MGQLGDVERVTCAEAARLKMPVLLVGGEQSPPLFKKTLAATKQCVAAAEVTTIIPKAGHQMNQHNSAAFDQALDNFLAP